MGSGNWFAEAQATPKILHLQSASSSPNPTLGKQPYCARSFTLEPNTRYREPIDGNLEISFGHDKGIETIKGGSPSGQVQIRSSFKHTVQVTNWAGARSDSWTLSLVDSINQIEANPSNCWQNLSIFLDLDVDFFF